MESLSVFHYHLRTGGITQVVTASLSALLAAEHPPSIERVRLVCGEHENAEEVADRIRLAAETAGRAEIAVETHIIPELRYVSDMERPPSPEEIERLMVERFSGDIWWIHNYHLGKNPPFTEALLRIAESRPAQRMVLHIHDFPESGRFENLEMLYSHLTLPWYPISTGVRYAVINARDYELLRWAGIPQRLLFLLDNPMMQLPRPGAKTEQEDGALSGEEEEAHMSPAAVIRDYWAARSASWEEGGRLALYPVRTIRRKNVLEAGLISRLLPVPINLLVTLPGTSSQQAGYSDFVGSCFAEGLIPGAWPVGSHLDEMGLTFSQLTGSTDLILSSSVQEGFGYLFLSALEWMTPLISRDLDILDGMRELFDNFPARFYSRILVPLSENGGARLWEEYRRRVVPPIRQILSGEEAQRIAEALRVRCAEKVVDFSFLSPALQKEVLQKLSNPVYAREVEELNGETLSHITEALEEGTVNKSGELYSRFGPEAHASQLRMILSSFDSQPSTADVHDGNRWEDGGPEAGVQDSPNGEGVGPEAGVQAAAAFSGDSIHRRVLSRFLSPDYMRLLFF